jgi:hypothetical protein
MGTYNKQKKTRFTAMVALIVFATLAVPCTVLAAERAGGRISGSFGSSSSNRAQSRFHRFHGPGFFDGDVGDAEVTTEQSQSTPATEPAKPADKGRYVPPHWVDGGYGVEVLEPGYWSGTEKTPK